MNEILLMIGDLPVRVSDALIGLGVLALILLFAIAMVIARGSRRGAELAMAQAIRADELEERLAEMLRAQSESSGRVDAKVDAFAQALNRGTREDGGDRRGEIRGVVVDCDERRGADVVLVAVVQRCLDQSREMRDAGKPSRNLPADLALGRCKGSAAFGFSFGGEQVGETLRVITLITPPMASEPYSDDIGPRTTSMRSMASSGGR